MQDRYAQIAEALISQMQRLEIAFLDSAVDDEVHEQGARLNAVQGVLDRFGIGASDSAVLVLSAMPHIVPGEPMRRTDTENLVAFLRRQFDTPSIQEPKC